MFKVIDREFDINYLALIVNLRHLNLIVFRHVPAIVFRRHVQNALQCAYSNAHNLRTNII